MSDHFSKGGKARAESLTAEERKEIAKKAAESRWAEKPIPEAICNGVLEIGDFEIACAVLKDGSRIISEGGISSKLGPSGGKTYRLRDKQAEKSVMGPLPLFLASKALEPFILEVFEEGDLNPVSYIDGDKEQVGFSASILPKVCEAWLKAKDAGALQKSQHPKAKNAEILMRGLAHIGIVALVDEATGYQDLREKDALQKILDKFLTDEAHKWSKTFPDEFWHKLIKIKGYPSFMALKRPSFVGHWVNNIVYDRLAPGISTKLKEINPRTGSGHRKSKHHQHLTEDAGVPELKEHINKVMLLMDVSVSDNEFKKLLDRALPRYGDTLEMDLD